MTVTQIGEDLIGASVGWMPLSTITPWVLLPLAGLFVALFACCLPELLQEPIRRLGWLTMYSTLPVGVAALGLAVGKRLLPADDFLWLMLRVYDLHHWTEDQGWLKPIALAPLLGTVGILSIVLARPGIIARLGQLSGLVGRVTLSLYVLSLFALVAPGPFKLQLDDITAEMRDRLQASLRLQRDAEGKYLADKSVMVLLSDKPAINQSHLSDIIREIAILAGRLNCQPDALATVGCPMMINLRRAVEQSLPPIETDPQSRNERTTNPAPGAEAASLKLKDLKAIVRAKAEVDATTETLQKRSRALKETIAALVDSSADLLPFGKLAAAVVSDLSLAAFDRYGGILIDRASRSAGTAVAVLGDLNVAQLVADIPAAIVKALANLYGVVLERGPWALSLGPEATQDQLDAMERVVKDAEAAVRPGSTISTELLLKQIRERDPRSGSAGNTLRALLDERARAVPEKAATEGR